MAQQVPKGYELVWADEFNQDGAPDTTNWSFEKGFVRNNELQWYQKENAWCEKGYLIIEARKEFKMSPDYKADYQDWRTSRQNIKYTSSSINTKGLHSFQYGLFEIRAKIRAEDGLWPAIWTLGVEGQWPNNGECDILEYYKNQILANFGWGSSERHKPIWKSEKRTLTSLKSIDFKNQFHIWKLVWTEDKMTIYVDDVLLNEISLEETFNTSDGTNPFRQPHYLLLNLAIGSNGGDPTQTDFPNRYIVDYVRVYQTAQSSKK